MKDNTSMGLLLVVLVIGWVLGLIAPIRIVENPHYQSKPVEAFY